MPARPQGVGAVLIKNYSSMEKYKKKFHVVFLKISSYQSTPKNPYVGHLPSELDMCPIASWENDKVILCVCKTDIFLHDKWHIVGITRA